MIRSLTAFGALVAFASLAPALPAGAMDLSSVDCAHAAGMMSSMPDHMAMSSPDPAMTTDRVFDGMSHAMMQHGAMMAGVELKCGKDAKSRAAAAKLLQQLEADGVMEAKDILATYNH